MKKITTIYMTALILVSICGGIFSSPAIARTQVSDENQPENQPEDQPEVQTLRSPSSENEARKFFRKPASDSASTHNSSSSNSGSGEHYLAIHVGSFIGSDTYQWGQTPHLSNAGRLNLGLTYRLSSMGSFADTAIRVDFMGFGLPEGNPVQVAILPMILFPEAGSKFPLYFGVGAGPGFFLNQISQESFLSINYELVAGARFFNVIDTTGFFIEGGLKDGFLLLTDGQYIGYFLSVGVVFAF